MHDANISDIHDQQHHRSESDGGGTNSLNISSRSVTSSGGLSMSVFDRLYGKYKYGPPQPPSPPPSPPPSDSEQLAVDSPDSPNRHRNSVLNLSFAHSKPPAAPKQPIEGFEKSVQRMRAVIEEKKRLKELEENEWKVEEEKYRKSRLKNVKFH